MSKHMIVLEKGARHQKPSLLHPRRHAMRRVGSLPLVVLAAIRVLGGLFVAALACACHSGASSASGDGANPAPVEECKTYEAAVNACFHRNLSIAHQTSLLPKSEDDRRRIAALCTENLQRIRTACR
jgi:hypothetical protein